MELNVVIEIDNATSEDTQSKEVTYIVTDENGYPICGYPVIQ